MALFRCFSVGRNLKNKKNEQSSSKKDFQSLLVQIQHHPTLPPSSHNLEPTTFDVAVPYAKLNNSRFNVRVLSFDSALKAEIVEGAYEGEDEKEHSPSIKKELSDFDLQGCIAVTSKGGYDPTDKEEKFPVLYANEPINQFEDKNDKYSEKSVEMIQSGHMSDPGIGKSEFWAPPKLKRSCSNLERRDVLRANSNSQSFDDLQEVSANQVANPESPRSVKSNCSADRVMLKRHSSSQVLPSGSKKLWWKLFLWSHRNVHRRKSFSSKSKQAVPARVALNSQCGYSSDTHEPKQGKGLGHVDSSESVPMNKSSIGKKTDDQRRVIFPNENPSFWPQNQWVAFSAESSSFSRVDSWVKDLKTMQTFPEDDPDGDNDRSTVFPPSPHAGRSLARTTSQLNQHHIANLSAEILNANSVVQSLNPASTVAHISGIGIRAIPAISHLSNLRSVNISNNSIVHVSPGFLPKSIHSLNLSRNRISTFDGLRELTRLRVLDLSYNRISRIGQGLSNCVLIKELYLAGNKISDVEGLHRLLKLTVLDLSFNKITTTKVLGQLVANYHSLQAINLLGNPVLSNIGDDQLRKAVTGLLPKLVYLNRQPLNPQRAREVSNNGVAKAALGNGSRSKTRRLLKNVGQGGPGFGRGHRSNASVMHRSASRTKSRNQNN